ncbi:hypothetical protein LCGC14_3110530, partial [marine sediment metagenome]
CWKYEEKYESCFDHLFLDFGHITIDKLLEEEYGVKFNDKEKFETEFFNFLSKMHEEKVIEPKKSRKK